jgi:hypothetical protein
MKAVLGMCRNSLKNYAEKVAPLDRISLQKHITPTPELLKAFNDAKQAVINAATVVIEDRLDVVGGKGEAFIYRLLKMCDQQIGPEMAAECDILIGASKKLKQNVLGFVRKERVTRSQQDGETLLVIISIL